MNTIFISYSRADIVVARFLQSEIQQIGFDSWLDIAEIRGGQNWRAEINQALSNSDALIVLMSPKSILSEYVAYEIKTFLGYDKPIIPIKIRSFDAEDLSAEFKEVLRYQLLDWTNTAANPSSDVENVLSNLGFVPSVSNLPIVRFNEVYRSNLAFNQFMNTQNTIDLALHKGNFLAGGHRTKLRQLIKQGALIRIILCEIHEAVTQQLWYRSERNWDDPTGQNMIAQQIKIGHRNIDSLLKTLTDSEKRRIEIRLIPYITPDPFYLVDAEYEYGFVTVFLRNFRADGNDAPFLSFKRSEKNFRIIEFYQREFERLWSNATLYNIDRKND